jgi:hypothetical protein
MLNPMASFASKISDEQFVRGILIAIPVDHHPELVSKLPWAIGRGTSSTRYLPYCRLDRDNAGDPRNGK